MDSQKTTLQSLLKSKAKLMADRNERFAVINEEVSQLKESIMTHIDEVKEKIKSAITEDDVSNE